MCRFREAIKTDMLVKLTSRYFCASRGYLFVVMMRSFCVFGVNRILGIREADEELVSF